MTLEGQKIFQEIAKGVAHLAVAVSGGPDSMALALLARDYCEANNIGLSALIVDHGLRSESASEAQYVGQTLAQHRIKSQILTWRGQKPSANIHEHARTMRYQLMTSYCKEHQISHLALGHHLDDQAETVMMRIFRGTGVDGLVAMKAKSKRDGVTLLRPLLSYSKMQLLEFVMMRGVAFVEDPSNHNLRFERVRIRQMMAEFPEIWRQRLVLLASNAQRSSSYLQQQADAAFEKLIVSDDPLAIDLNQYRSLHEEIALRVLNLLLKQSGAIKGARLRSLLKLHHNLHEMNPKTITLGGCVFRCRKGRVMLIPEIK